MKEDNNKSEAFGDYCNKWSGQDIRFATFIDWVNEQPQEMIDVMIISLHFAHAYGIKFNDKFHGKTRSDYDDMILARVEKALATLGLSNLLEEKLK